jgi:hypothetical protein
MIPYFARLGLLISLAAVSLTSSIVSAPATEQTTIDECRQQYSALRLDVEAKAQPIRDVRDVSHRRLPASTLCKLVTTYEEAELRMISFIEANSSKCRIPDEIPCEQTRTDCWSTNAEASAIVAGKDRRGKAGR